MCRVVVQEVRSELGAGRTASDVSNEREEARRGRLADRASALAAVRAMRSRAVVMIDLALPVLVEIDVMQIVGQEQLPVSVIMNSAIAPDLLHLSLRLGEFLWRHRSRGHRQVLMAFKLAPLLAQQRQDLRPGAHARIVANAMGNVH